MDADSTGGRTIGAKYSWPMNRSARGGGEGRLEILKFKWGAQPPPVVVVYGIVTANWIGRDRARRGRDRYYTRLVINIRVIGIVR